MKPQEFHNTISGLLEARLGSMVAEDREMNLLACVEIYTKIFDTLVECLTEANVPITNDAMNYLAQQYYDGVQVNGSYSLDPDIFTQRAKLDDMETKELALLAVMLQGTDFSLPVLEEIKKRS